MIDVFILFCFSTEGESPTPIFSKAERDQDLQKYYRAELIEHLTGWQSGQLEKQVRKFLSYMKISSLEIILVFENF